MSNPTTPFSWQMPTATDLVTDLPADFEVFGQAVATSMADLLGGTSGQILAKNSNTDMDFVWIANDQGDITGVTAGTGITGGGTSGAVTITNDMATTITASGDIVVGTGSGTYDNLPIGTTNQVLTADTTVSPYKVKWATVTTTAPGLAFVTSATFTAATTVSINSCFTSTYDNYLVTLTPSSGSGACKNFFVKMRLSGTDSSTGYAWNQLTTLGTTVSSATLNGQTTGWPTAADNDSLSAPTQFTLMSPFIASVNTVFAANSFQSGSGGQGLKITNGFHTVTSAYDGITINWTNSATGTVRVYGLRNS